MLRIRQYIAPPSPDTCQGEIFSGETVLGINCKEPLSCRNAIFATFTCAAGAECTIKCSAEPAGPINQGSCDRAEIMITGPVKKFICDGPFACNNVLFSVENPAEDFRIECRGNFIYMSSKPIPYLCFLFSVFCY